MIRQNSKVLLPSGLHILNVAKLKDIVGNSESLAFLTAKGKTVNCINLAELLSLGLKFGDEVAVLVDGIDEEEVIKQILKFLNNQ